MLAAGSSAPHGAKMGRRNRQVDRGGLSAGIGGSADMREGRQVLRSKGVNVRGGS